MGVDIKFAAVYFQKTPAQYVEWVRVADEVGFDLIGTGDSQSLWPELYVLLTLTALNTSTAQVGPVVTNPITRHPAVAASGIAALQDVSDGRAFYGLGSGDSAVYNLGLKACRVDEVAEHADVIRRLCNGEAVDYRGDEIQLHWPTRRVPIYLAAEGPRMLRLAGRIADGVFVAGGLSPEVIAHTRALIAEGARSAGRDPDDIEVWWMVKFLLAESEQAGIDTLKFTLSSSANHAFRFSFDDKLVPERYQEPIRKLQERYVFSEHAQVHSSGANAALVEELGLTDWLAERFAITGPPELCAERIQEIASMGASNLLLTQLVPDPLAEMRRWSRDLFPLVR